MRKISAFLVTLGLIAGCGHDDKDNGASGVVNPGPVFSLDLLGDGPNANYRVENRSYFVVRDAVAWQFLYKWVTGDTVNSAPTVDFAGGDVAAAVIYPCNNAFNSIEFSSISVDLPKPTTVNVRETLPPPYVKLAYMPSWPYALAGFASDPNQSVHFTRSQVVSGDPTEMMLKILIIGTERLFREMAVEEAYDRMNLQSTTGPKAAKADIPYLLSMACPRDKTTLEVVALKYGTGMENEPDSLSFCPEHGEYWFHHPDNDGWTGPHTPGLYK